MRHQKLGAAVRVLIGVVAAGLCLCAARADNDPWRADLEALKQGLAQNYANFADQVTVRRIDLPALAAEAEAGLAAAADDAARRAVLERVVKAMRDPHVKLAWPAAAAGDGGPGPACAPKLVELERKGGLAWERLPAFAPLEDAPSQMFRAGVLTTASGARLGVLRIGLFMPQGFAEACAEAAAGLGMTPDAPCDGECTGRMDSAAGAILNGKLVETLDALKGAGVTRIVLDITDNHGGSDWVEPVVRILGGAVHAARLEMVRHPAWVADMEARLADLETTAKAQSGAHAAEIDAAIAAGRAALGELGSPCDLTGAWEAAVGTALPCSNLVRGPLYSTGFLDYAPGPISRQLFNAARYAPYREGATDLPIVLLVNGETHSSAELIAAALQDAKKAVVMGTVTSGAGCGQATAGTGFTLPHSGGVVRVPDCVRLRADGTSERRGITPDVLIAWAPSDSPALRAEKAAAALAQAAP